MSHSKTSFSASVVELHRLYAEFKRPVYLEMAAMLGKVPDSPSFDEVWEKKVNDGCIREGLPLMYPEDGDKPSPLPEPVR